MRLLATMVCVCLPLVSAAAQGSLMLVGGGTENYNQWSDQPYSWFVQQADSGKIINIDVDSASSWYPNYFIWLGADQSSHELRIATRTAANDSATYVDLASAGGIFIEGGDQWDYVSTWKGTLVEDAIHEVFDSGGAIGGTSAGLAILGEVVFDAHYGSAYPEDVAYDPYDNRVSFTDDFLTVLPNVITDSHFHERGRMGRLVAFMARRIQDFGDEGIVGIGVEGYTAFCIAPDHVGSVYGETVTILSADEGATIVCEHNRPVTFSPLTCDQLLHHARYDLTTGTLLDPGDFLEPMDDPLPDVPGFTPVVLDGSSEDTADFGEVIITGLTSDPDNWWHGDLEQEPGQAVVPRSVIIPRLWSDYDYYANRWTGGMLGLATNPYFHALYVDDGCSTEVESNGMLTVDQLTYVVENHNASYTGENNYHIPGVVGAVIHFFGPGDQFDLSGSYEPGAGDGLDEVPGAIRIDGVYPNPFYRDAVCRFSLPIATHGSLRLHDLSGKYVASLFEGQLSRGSQVVGLSVRDLVAGTYVLVLDLGSRRETMPVTVMR